MDILTAMHARRAVRAYLDRPVEPEKIRAVLDAARQAPSGANIQPWQVAVVQGETRQRLGQALIAAREAGQPENPDYPYYPEKWHDPWRGRRQQCGLALYKALGIGREDSERRKQAWYRNYHFFGAPVGLLFFLDESLGTGSLIDTGIFMQGVMLAATGQGLATCPQAALAEYPDVVREILALESRLRLVCGMALGYADADHPINQYRLPRCEIDEFTRWYD